VWGPLAQTGTYSTSTTTCTGTYCHGGALKDPTAVPVNPNWTDTTLPGCRSCHGVHG
jgi:predicted CxxxxCH...CXXCH cytochrome family protein